MARRQVHAGGRARRPLLVGLMAGTLVATLAPVATGVLAAEPGQVTGLAVEQREGFALLSWDPIDGAGQYEIYRTPVDDSNVPTDDSDLVGVWRPNRTVTPDEPTFADAGFAPGDRFGWEVRAIFGSGLPFEVIVDAPSGAAGTYGASGATFGPPPDATGIAGTIELGSDGTGTNPTRGCNPLVGFTPGNIALLDRGTCNFTVKALNAQNAGATAMVLVNDRGGNPTTMTGTNNSITISSVMVSQDDGNFIKTGLPATGTVHAAPVAPLSDPVYGTTLPQWGNEALSTEGLRTQWEQTAGAQYTSDVNEYAYTEAIASQSPRMRYTPIATTAEGRDVNLLIFGYPAAPPTAEAVAAGPTALVNCNVHGNEPSSREACFILARRLAFSTEPRVIDLLSNMTILLVPSINADGRAHNTRGNTTGQDLNRDHSLLTQPETRGYSEMLRDYQPAAGFDGHEFGNSNAGDLPVLPPRHLNVPQEIFDQSVDMIEGHMYTAGSEQGWWFCPYGCEGGGAVGLGQETILRNTSGLKNTVASLLEARSAGGPTRPNESNTQQNRRRKTYSAMWTYNEFFDYFRANTTEIYASRDAAIAWQVSNSGPIYLDGTREMNQYPAPHPGEAPPPDVIPSPSEILDPAPCGYFLTDAQVNDVLSDSPPGFPTSAGERFASHGWTVDDRATGYVVRLAQAQRGLIPLLLDDAAPAEMVDGVRLYECPWITVDPSALAAGTTEGTTTDASLAIGNVAPEPDQPLDWSISEASSDCGSPSDLDWVSTSSTSGTTASGSSSSVGVEFDAAGLTAPDSASGLLCISSNDAGAPVVAVPIHLQAQYPFGGFQVPIGVGASPKAGSTIPVKFDIGGDRGLEAVVSITTYEVDCGTGEPTGPETAAASNGGLVWDGEKYQYDWKTSKGFAGQCRALELNLADSTDLVPNAHVVVFEFR